MFPEKNPITKTKNEVEKKEDKDMKGQLEEISMQQASLNFLRNPSQVSPKILQGHDSEITLLGLLPDNKLISGDEGGDIRIWDLQTGEALNRFMGFPNPIFCTLPNKRLAISSPNNKKIHIFKIQRDVKELFASPSVLGADDSVIDAGDYVSSLSLLPDGTLASSHYCSIKFWNLENGTLIKTLWRQELGIVHCLYSLLDGKLASGSRDIKIWDLRTEKCIRTLTSGHITNVLCLKQLPDGRIASGSDDTTVRIWHTDEGTCTILKGHPISVESLEVAPNGMLLSTSRKGTFVDHMINIWDPKTGALIQTLTVDVKHYSGIDYIWDPKKGALIPRLNSGDYARSILSFDSNQKLSVIIAVGTKIHVDVALKAKVENPQTNKQVANALGASAEKPALIFTPSTAITTASGANASKDVKQKTEIAQVEGTIGAVSAAADKPSSSIVKKIPPLRS